LLGSKLCSPFGKWHLLPILEKLATFSTTFATRSKLNTLDWPKCQNSFRKGLTAYLDVNSEITVCSYKAIFGPEYFDTYPSNAQHDIKRLALIRRSFLIPIPAVRGVRYQEAQQSSSAHQQMSR
jgi:hypothetical protein